MEQEREISINELMASCLRKGKQIVIIVLAATVLGGWYKWKSQQREFALKAAELLELENVKELDTVEGWEEKAKLLIEQDEEAVLQSNQETKENLKAQIANYEKRMSYLRSYISESLLMKIDPYNKYESSLYFSISDIDPGAYDQSFGEEITPEEYLRNKIVSQYASLWDRADLSSELGIDDFSGLPEKYILEVLNFSNYGDGVIRIRAAGNSAEMTEKMARASYAYLSSKSQEAADLSYPHTISLVSSNTVMLIDTALNENQGAIYSELEELKSTYEELKTELKEQEKPKTSSPAIDLIKSAVVFGILGGILACMWCAVGYIFSGKIGSSSQLSNWLGLTAIGNMSGNHTYLDCWADRLCGEKVWQDRDSACTYIRERVDFLCGERNQVAILSTVVPPESFIADLDKIAGIREVKFADNATMNPRAVGLIKTSDCIIMAENIGKSKIEDINSIKKLAEETGKTIEGVILF